MDHYDAYKYDNQNNQILYEEPQENDTDSIKHAHECVFEYTEYDMEIDLLNIYSSVDAFYRNSIHDIKTIEKIEKKYAMIKAKNHVAPSDSIKKLIETIDSEMIAHKITLNSEVKKTRHTFDDFKHGFGLGLGFGILTTAFICVLKARDN